MHSRRYLSAAQAAKALGVSRATLYAYTSRGHLRSEPIPGRARERRYARDDVDRLNQRKEARRDPAKAAAQGLRWGSPVLESGITFIHEGRFYYRGQDAIELAKAWSLEQVATLLWGADAKEASRLFDQRCALEPRRCTQLRALAVEPLAQMQAALPLGAAADVAAYDLRPSAVRLTGARIVRLLTAMVTGNYSQDPVHIVLQTTWTPKKKAVADVLRTALVLCADHELNVSSFTARCAASAGATPYDIVAAGLATLKGFKHGAAAARVLALVRGCATPKSARAAVAERLRQGERIPGFGHPLYPSGDPRAKLLIQLAQASGNDIAWRSFRNFSRTGSQLLQEAPNLDFGLAAVVRTYCLPNDAAMLLFALGRTIGWIAHALEEYASDKLIRPRARYIGPTPALESHRGSERPG